MSEDELAEKEEAPGWRDGDQTGDGTISGFRALCATLTPEFASTLRTAEHEDNAAPSNAPSQRQVSSLTPPQPAPTDVSPELILRPATFSASVTTDGDDDGGDSDDDVPLAASLAPQAHVVPPQRPPNVQESASSRGPEQSYTSCVEQYKAVAVPPDMDDDLSDLTSLSDSDEEEEEDDDDILITQTLGYSVASSEAPISLSASSSTAVGSVPPEMSDAAVKAEARPSAKRKRETSTPEGANIKSESKRHRIKTEKARTRTKKNSGKRKVKWPKFCKGDEAYMRIVRA